MDEHTPPPPERAEDLRVFLFFGIPIFMITVLLATFIVTIQPTRGQ